MLEQLNAHNIPCGPILSTKELIEDETLAELGSVVEVAHPERGSFKTVGCPLKLSDSPVEIERLAAAGRAQRRGAGRTRLRAKPSWSKLRAAGVI